LTSALDGEWSASSPGRFTPRERAKGLKNVSLQDFGIAYLLKGLEPFSSTFSTYFTYKNDFRV
jgi:hypothetical protein